MTLLKAPVLPSLLTDKWMSDFFDNDRFFDADWLKRIQVVPAVNVKELEKEFEIEMAIPGLKKEDFNIQIDKGVMTIFAEKKEESNVEEDRYTRTEFNYSNFSRSFNLPENVDPERVEAWYEDGLLRLLISKKELTSKAPKKSVIVK